MAYGAWKDVTTTLKTGSNYKITAKWKYCQDPIANKTKIRTEYLNIVSTGKYSFTAGSGTCGLYATGASNTKTQATGNISVGAGKTVQVNTADQDVEISHNQDGTFPASKSLRWYLNLSYIPAGFPSYTRTSWQTTAISGIPKIDRAKPTLKFDGVSPSYKQISVKLITKTAGTIYVKLSTASSWTKVKTLGTGGGTVNYTITGLSPKKSYTIEAYAQRTLNNLKCDKISYTVTTKTVATPVVPAISASDITETSVKIRMASGGTLYDKNSKYDGQVGSLKLYIYKDADFTGNTGVHESTISEMRSGYVWSGLEEGHVYGFKLSSRAPISNEYTSSNELIIRTLGGYVFTYIKTASGWKTGIVYIKTPSGWKQGTVYVKTQSGWKQAV